MTTKNKLVCPSCNATNAIPANRLGDGPLCGKCKESIFSAHPVELDQTGFQKHIASNDIPVLVDFWAPWCQPCLMMAPEFEQAAAQLEPNIRLVKLNTEAVQGIGQQYNIRSIPTMVMFLNGREIARQSGAMMSGDIVRWAEQNSNDLR
jgi:thioredoxin 2